MRLQRRWVNGSIERSCRPLNGLNSVVSVWTHKEQRTRFRRGKGITAPHVRGTNSLVKSTYIHRDTSSMSLNATSSLCTLRRTVLTLSVNMSLTATSLAELGNFKNSFRVSLFSTFTVVIYLQVLETFVSSLHFTYSRNVSSLHGLSNKAIGNYVSDRRYCLLTG